MRSTLNHVDKVMRDPAGFSFGFLLLSTKKAYYWVSQFSGLDNWTAILFQ